MSDNVFIGIGRMVVKDCGRLFCDDLLCIMVKEGLVGLLRGGVGLGGGKGVGFGWFSSFGSSKGWIWWENGKYMCKVDGRIDRLFVSWWI